MTRAEFLRLSLATATTMAASSSMGLVVTAGPALRWRPSLRNPIVVHAEPGDTSLPHQGDTAVAVQDPAQPWLWLYKPTLDVVVVFPDEPYRDGITIYGGRNVRTIGGNFLGTWDSGVLLSFDSQVSSVFCEGAFVDVQGYAKDGIATRRKLDVLRRIKAKPSKALPRAVIQSCRIVGVDGLQESTHGDCVQAQCFVDQLCVENCTLESAYQGIFPLFGSPLAGPRRGLYLNRVNAHHYPDSRNPIHQNLAAYYFHHVVYNVEGGNKLSKNYPIRLTEVYAGEHGSDATIPWGQVITIPDTRTAGVQLRSDASSDYLDYSQANLDIGGIVRRGLPPSGDFAPEQDVGASYQSPWGMP